ncbi:hypothetical protein V6N11_007580 [Hibiscus sabdariffa]|uniref:Uncharacterized protein n=1 Tax=Hibiscus sabdariffa TaxID=183260 RepID=A0ABR1ZAK4_9ROSI
MAAESCMRTLRKGNISNPLRLSPRLADVTFLCAGKSNLLSSLRCPVYLDATGALFVTVHGAWLMATLGFFLHLVWLRIELLFAIFSDIVWLGLCALAGLIRWSLALAALCIASIGAAFAYHGMMLTFLPYPLHYGRSSATTSCQTIRTLALCCKFLADDAWCMAVAPYVLRERVTCYMHSSTRNDCIDHLTDWDLVMCPAGSSFACWSRNSLTRALACVRVCTPRHGSAHWRGTVISALSRSCPVGLAHERSGPCLSLYAASEIWPTSHPYWAELLDATAAPAVPIHPTTPGQ